MQIRILREIRDQAVHKRKFRQTRLNIKFLQRSQYTSFLNLPKSEVIFLFLAFKGLRRFERAKEIQERFRRCVKNIGQVLEGVGDGALWLNMPVFFRPVFPEEKFQVL